MSIEKKFLNSFNIELTAQQANKLDTFIEMTYENDRLKEEKSYYENELEYINIYVYPDENLDEVLNSISYTDTEYNISKDLEEAYGCKLWKCYLLENGQLSLSYDVTIWDSQNRRIAWRSYDDSGQISDYGKKKYYIGGNVLYDEDGLVDIGYAEGDCIIFDHSNGNLVINMSLMYGDDGSYTSVESFTNIWGDLLPFMSSEILDYFSNLNPLMPNVSLYD